MLDSGERDSISPDPFTEPTTTPGTDSFTDEGLAVPFDLHIGIDYSGAETATARLPALRVFAAGDAEPAPSGRKAPSS